MVGLEGPVIPSEEVHLEHGSGMCSFGSFRQATRVSKSQQLATQAEQQAERGNLPAARAQRSVRGRTREVVFAAEPTEVSSDLN